MKRNVKIRMLVALAATLFAALCGSVAGYMAGRAVLLRQASGMLQQSASAAMRNSEASSGESRRILATMNASTFPFCSETEIAWFRELIFQSEYLKDAGRIRDGKVYCSATRGRLAIPVAQTQTGIAQADGTLVYRNLTPFRIPNQSVLALAFGDSLVVFSPYMKAHWATRPVYFTTTSIADPSHQAFGLMGTRTIGAATILIRDGQGVQGENLYATRCSPLYLHCITTYISRSDALQTHRGELSVMVVAGGASGAFLGFLLSLLYRRNQSLEHQLRRAIRRDQLRVVYQPVVSLSSGRIVGAEALSRWTDEEGAAISPDVFIKIAEQRGFVGEITRRVVRNVVRDFADVFLAHPNFRLSINVAADDLADPGFLPMLDRTLAEANVPAASLVIEITEGTTASQGTAIETILSLRQRGHSVHIDDFGTGYSSLSYLHDLSVDAIKIDRSFTQAIGTEAVTVAILPQILAMANALKLQVIVEGIETTQQADYFSGSVKPVLAQGWLFGRPLPAEEFHHLLAEDDKMDCARPAIANDNAALTGTVECRRSA